MCSEFCVASFLQLDTLTVTNSHLLPSKVIPPLFVGRVSNSNIFQSVLVSSLVVHISLLKVKLFMLAEILVILSVFCSHENINLFIPQFSYALSPFCCQHKIIFPLALIALILYLHYMSLSVKILFLIIGNLIFSITSLCSIFQMLILYIHKFIYVLHLFSFYRYLHATFILPYYAAPPT